MSDLEDKIKGLRRKVQEGEEALQRAGQYGLQLLDDKMDLHNKLEEQRVEMSNVIEVLTQHVITQCDKWQYMLSVNESLNVLKCHLTWLSNCRSWNKRNTLYKGKLS